MVVAAAVVGGEGLVGGGQVEEAGEPAEFLVLLGDRVVDGVGAGRRVVADDVIAVLPVGRPVVCETSLATSVADADWVIAAARETGLLATVFAEPED